MNKKEINAIPVLLILVFIFSNVVLYLASGDFYLAALLFGFDLFILIIIWAIIFKKNGGRILSKANYILFLSNKLSSPLAALKWNLRTLIDGDWGELNEQQLKFLRRSYMANEQVIRLIDNLLTIARLEEKGHRLQLTKNNLIDLIDGVVKDFKTKADESNIKINFNKPAKIIPIIQVDNGKMKLALSNLIDNGIRYNLAGGRLNISVDNENGSIKIMVADNGVGIPQNQLVKAFTKFFRSDNIIKMGVPGFGLGLYLVKLIIEGHGGKVSLTSAEHKGSTFSIILPI